MRALSRQAFKRLLKSSNGALQFCCLLCEPKQKRSTVALAHLCTLPTQSAHESCVLESLSCPPAVGSLIHVQLLNVSPDSSTPPLWVQQLLSKNEGTAFNSSECKLQDDSRLLDDWLHHLQSSCSQPHLYSRRPEIIRFDEARLNDCNLVETHLQQTIRAFKRLLTIRLPSLPCFSPPDSLHYHPNFLQPFSQILLNNHSLALLCHCCPFSLQDAFTFSTKLFSSPTRRLFVLFQLGQALWVLHSRGLSHGSLRPWHILLSDQLWVQLCGYCDSSNDSTSEFGFSDNKESERFEEESAESTAESSIRNRILDNSCQRQGVGTRKESLVEENDAIEDFELSMGQWLRGEQTNYEYLLALNRVAGRQFGNPDRHPIFPWVADLDNSLPFSSSPSLRDLGRSKFRLVKGDEQLQEIYRSGSKFPVDEKHQGAPGDDNRHHVSEPLSELSYCIYKARRLPVAVLTRAVRQVFVPHEYPASVARIFSSSPDEAIPEFFSGKGKPFTSTHSDMADLSLPDGVSSPSEFYMLHRKVLESDEISCRLHHWIDLTFGYKLSGQPGYDELNIALMQHVGAANHGYVQLFCAPHPSRRDNNIDLSQSPCFRRALLHQSDSPSVQEEAQPFSHPRLKKLSTLIKDRRHSETTTTVDNAVHDLTEPLRSSSDSSARPFFNPRHLPVSYCNTEDVLNGTSSMAQDTFALGVIAVKLLAPEAVLTPASRFWVKPEESLPSSLSPSVRRAIVGLLAPNYLERSSVGQFMELPLFPEYFSALYLFLLHYHAFHGYQERLGLCCQCFPWLVSVLPPQGFELLLPFLLPLLSHPDTYTESLAPEGLLFQLSAVLPPARLAKHCIKPLIRLFQLYPEDRTLAKRLFDSQTSRLLLKLLGQKAFVLHLMPYYLRAVCIEMFDEWSAPSLCLTDIITRLPVRVTLRHLLYPLLGQLAHPRGEKAVLSLSYIGRTLGQRVITFYMLPWLLKLLQTHGSRISKGETILLTALDLISRLVPSLSPSSAARSLLVDSLQLPVMLLNPAPSLALLEALADAFLSLTTLLRQPHQEDWPADCQFLSAEHALGQILGYLSQFFSNYSELYDGTPRLKESVDSMLAVIYSPESVELFFGQFETVVGIEKLRSEIPNSELIENILHLHRNKRMNLEEAGSRIRAQSLPIATVGRIRKQNCADWLVTLPLDNCMQNDISRDEYEELGHTKAFDIAREWRLNGDVSFVFCEHTSPISCLALHDDELYFATGGRDSTVRLWSLERERSLFTYGNHDSAVTSLCFLEGDLLASVANSVHVWDPSTASPSAFFSRPSGVLGTPSRYVSVAPFRGGRSIVAGCSDSTLSLIDLRANTSLDWKVGFCGLQTLAVGPNEHWIAAGGPSGTVALLDLRTGHQLYLWCAHPSASVLHILAPHSDCLLSSCASGSLALWHLQNPPCCSREFLGHDGPVYTFDLLDGDLISASGLNLGVGALHGSQHSVNLSRASLRFDSLEKEKVSGSMVSKRFRPSSGGSIRSLHVLPLHRMLLASVDNAVLACI